MRQKPSSPKKPVHWLTPFVIVGSLGAAQAAIVAAPACAQTKPAKTSAVPNAAAAPVEGYTLPFTPLDGYGGPVVRARINDKADAFFLLDTGSSISTISSDLAKKLNLPIKEKRADKDTGFVPPGTLMHNAVVDAMSVSGLPVTGEFLLFDELVPSYLPGEHLDGLLGMDLMKHFAVVFDFERNEAVLIPKGKLNETQLVYLGMKNAAGNVAVGGKLQSRNSTDPVCTTAVQVGDAKGFTATIDTGGPWTFVKDPDKKIKIPTDAAGATSVAYSAGQNWKYTAYPFPLFATGDAPNMVKQSGLSPFECGIIAPDAIGAEGCLGIDYLSRFRVLMDFPANRWYLIPVANAKKQLYPTDASRASARRIIADMVLAPSAYGVWVVIATEKDGPFGKRGIVAGDVLDTMDGESVSGKRFADIYTILDTHMEKNNGQMEMGFLRDKQVVKIHVGSAKAP